MIGTPDDRSTMRLATRLTAGLVGIGLAVLGMTTAPAAATDDPPPPGDIDSAQTTVCDGLDALPAVRDRLCDPGPAADSPPAEDSAPDDTSDDPDDDTLPVPVPPVSPPVEVPDPTIDGDCDVTIVTIPDASDMILWEIEGHPVYPGAWVVEHARETVLVDAYTEDQGILTWELDSPHADDTCAPPAVLSPPISVDPPTPAVTPASDDAIALATDTRAAPQGRLAQTGVDALGWVLGAGIALLGIGAVLVARARARRAMGS